MRTAWLLLLFLVGCADSRPPAALGSEAGDDAQVSWFLHGNGTDDTWMDADQHSTAIGVWGYMTPAGAPHEWRFPLRGPGVAAVEVANITLNVTYDQNLDQRPRVQVSLYDGDRLVGQGLGERGTIHVGRDLSQAAELRVCFCPGETPIVTGYVLMLDGTSRIDLT